MADVNHSAVNVASRHPIHGVAEFASAAARTANVYSSSDEGKVVRQTDTDTWYLITDVTAGVATFQRIHDHEVCYRGYGTGNLNWSSNTWTAALGVPAGGITNVESSGITRSSSQFTVTKDGLYLVSLATLIYNSAGGRYVGFRLHDGSATLAQSGSYSAAAQVGHPSFNWLVRLLASTPVTLQYCGSGGTPSDFVSTTLDGEVMRTLTLNIVRM